MDVVTYLRLQQQNKLPNSKKELQKKLKCADGSESDREKFNTLLSELMSQNIISPTQQKFIQSMGKMYIVPRANQWEKLSHYIQTHMMIRTEQQQMFEQLKNRIIIEPNLQTINNFVQNILTNGFKLTYEQNQAVHTLIDFLKSDRTSFGLYGYAGTGKTTLIVLIVQYLLAQKAIQSVGFVAPTNTAVTVIKSRFIDILELFPFSERTEEHINDPIKRLQNEGFKVDFMTIHRLLNYKNDFDVDGNKIFTKTSKSKIGLYHLVIIDECSMLGQNILVSIVESIQKNPYAKVIFTGDPVQLPPVKEKESWIFAKTNNSVQKSDYIQARNPSKSNIDSVINLDTYIQTQYDIFVKYILSIPNITLQNISRTNSQSIIKVCNEIRQMVLIRTIPRIRKCSDNKTVFVYKYIKSKSKIDTEWFHHYVELLQQSNTSPEHDQKSVQKQRVSSVILAWTNKQVDTYNSTVRNSIYAEKIKNSSIMKYEVGDILILKGYYSDQVESTKFYTSQPVKVISSELVIKVVDSLRETFKSSNNFRERTDIKNKYMQIVQQINKNTTRSYHVWKLQVEKMDSTPECKIGTRKYFTLYVDPEQEQDVNPDNLAHPTQSKLQKDRTYASNLIKKLVSYYKSIYSDQIKLLTSRVIKPLWGEYSSIFIEPFAEVNYGFGMTVHKAQSSTLGVVFIDLHDILQNANHHEGSKCLYTAVSRASESLHILL